METQANSTRKWPDPTVHEMTDYQRGDGSTRIGLEFQNKQHLESWLGEKKQEAFDLGLSRGREQMKEKLRELFREFFK